MREHLIKDWGKAAIEVLKWLLVLWLLWPLSQLKEGSIQFTRVVLGILLFIIFAGKVFYDTIIMGMVRQKRTTVKQDIIMLVGMVAGVAVLIGLVVLLVALMIVQFARSASTPLQ